MANEAINDFSVALGNLFDTAGKLLQQNVDLFGTAAKAIVSVVEPLTKTALDLAGNVTNTAGQLLQNVTCTAGQAVQNVTAVIIPKK
jgi:chlorosome envelope protein B